MNAYLIAPYKGKGDPIAHAQIQPFYDNRRTLKNELGLVFRHIHANTFAEIEKVFGQSLEAELFFVRPSWQEDPFEAERVMQKARSLYPDSKIFLIDPFDQTSSRFFNVLPYVDRLLKFQCLADPKLYRKDYIGGSLMTDKLARELGYELNGWHVGSTVPDGYESRIVPSWFALSPQLKRRILTPKMPWQRQAIRKDLDVFCHVSVGKRDNLEWYGQYRKAAIDTLERLSTGYKVSLSADYFGEPRVSTKQYHTLMGRSRIAFSPLGWGEITARGYEAILHGCLLIQPRVDHVLTSPNIFIPNETYIPVKWDYSDLEDKIKECLKHPDQVNRIIQNARKVFFDYFTQKGFVSQVSDIVSLQLYSDLRVTSVV